MPATADHLSVKVTSAFKVLYEGAADSVSAVNATGPFDVLAEHTKFFTVLLPGEVNVARGDEVQSFPIERGIMVVADNRVTVYTGL